MRWVGIDEAGYGPNLGPLVMTAVVAESCRIGLAVDAAASRPEPDLWRDLADSVDRAGGDPSRLWVDDSKRILSGGKGRDRLETTCLAVLQAIFRAAPDCPEDLYRLLGAGDSGETELARWPREGIAATWPSAKVQAALQPDVEGRVLAPADGAWRLTAVKSVVLGPERFNQRLDRLDSKAAVHFTAFRELLDFVWGLAADGRPTAVSGDKHGGRHYYLEPLTEAFPDVWIERGNEGPTLSHYRLKAPGRTLGLSLIPRADRTSGLVALASIVSKTSREVWMDRFNGFWMGRLEGLRPTAGYPVDAARFRLAIEPRARELGLGPEVWWRRK